jgi:hypothetical protein
MIPPLHRQFGYGMTLGKSYLHYGPLLGYKASVFNLVYANNAGSLRYAHATLWDNRRCSDNCWVESGTRWASLVWGSFHARVDCDARMGMEKNGLILLFIIEVSWMRKNGHAR